MPIRDYREVRLSVARSSDTFRTLLSNKGIENMNVDPSVMLYADQGFDIAMKNEPGNPFKIITDAFGRLKKLTGVAGMAMKMLTSGAALASTSDRGTSWIPWMNNVQSFKDSGPITLIVTFKFQMGEFGLWDGREEVFLPIMNLMSMFLPAGIDGINIMPHIRTSTQLLWDSIGEVAGDLSSLGSSAFNLKSTETAQKGINVENITRDLTDLFSSLSTKMGTVVVNSINERDDNLINISYAGGKFRYRKMQPVNCHIEFSNKEYDDNGFPAIGKIQMTFQSFQPATLMGIRQNSITFGFIETQKRN